MRKNRLPSEELITGLASRSRSRLDVRIAAGIHLPDEQDFSTTQSKKKKKKKGPIVAYYGTIHDISS